MTPLCVPQSGVGTYTLNLWDHLEAMRPGAVVPFAHRSLVVQQRHLGVPTVPRFSVNKTLWMQLLLPAQMSRKGIDVAHFTNSVASLFSTCPMVTTLHDMTLWLYPQHHYRRRLLAMRPLIPAAARRSAAIITVSESAKADIVNVLGVSPSKVHVIYEAADAAFRPLTVAESESLLRPLHLPERYVLSVGTLEPRKNLERLVEAFAALVRDGYPHHLVFAGQRGWKEASLFAAIERLGLGSRVRFLDFLPLRQLVALYNRAEIMAFPSLYEGFGLPVIEAMACGTAVLTSRRGSLAEIAGEAAHFVEPTSVESIRNGLAAIVDSSDYRFYLQGQGRARAANFSWHAAAAQTWKVYESVAVPRRTVANPNSAIREP